MDFLISVAVMILCSLFIGLLRLLPLLPDYKTQGAGASRLPFTTKSAGGGQS